jgi:lysophospholipase L1-like esterase
MEMEKHQLFKGVHPNILGNQLFAKEIADSFNQWIDNVV